MLSCKSALCPLPDRQLAYSCSIWTAKLAVCEFLSRLSEMLWRRSIIFFLRFIRYFLASTLVAVIIATLAECQPFNHYWQVVPDPGTACRSGYANLITMGACSVMTDLLLVAFPIPIILMAKMPWKRKLLLVCLFALSLILVIVTCYRVPTVIEQHGSQQYRSLLASLEILASTAVSNTVVIGSFVRDKGAKKTKFKRDQASASVNNNMDQSSVRRHTVTHHQWGSDSDLAADLGHPPRARAVFRRGQAAASAFGRPIPRPKRPHGDAGPQLVLQAAIDGLGRQQDVRVRDRQRRHQSQPARVHRNQQHPSQAVRRHRHRVAA